MSIQFRCPTCQASYTVEDKYAGRRAKCGCGNVTAVPLHPEATPVADPENDSPIAATKGPRPENETTLCEPSGHMPSGVTATTALTHPEHAEEQNAYEELPPQLHLLRLVCAVGCTLGIAIVVLGYVVEVRSNVTTASLPMGYVSVAPRNAGADLAIKLLGVTLYFVASVPLVYLNGRGHTKWMAYFKRNHVRMTEDRLRTWARRSVCFAALSLGGTLFFFSFIGFYMGLYVWGRSNGKRGKVGTLTSLATLGSLVIIVMLRSRHHS
jgi:hypothetical protein